MTLGKTLKQVRRWRISQYVASVKGGLEWVAISLSKD